MDPVVVLLIVLLMASLGLSLRLYNRHGRFRRDLRTVLGSGSDSEPALLAAAASSAERTDSASARASRLESAVRRAPIGIAIMDESGDEIVSNAPIAAYWEGRGGDAVVGIRLRELVAEALSTGEPQERQVDVFTPSKRVIMLSARPLDVDGQRHGAVAFAVDMTPETQVETIRRDFVANASHELKTPLGALRLLAEALVATPDPEVRASLSERVQNEATRMTRLVDDILDLSLIEEHQTLRSVVNVCDIVEDAIQQAKLASETLGVPVEVECSAAEVLGDHRRLVSAVANLVENAITYTAAKGEDLPLPVVVAAGSDGDSVFIEVTDHGIGIAERHQARIFERFYRVDQGRSRVSGGTGLGLAIVRHVVQNHWGEVEVESVPGQGSTFRVLLPAREN